MSPRGQEADEHASTTSTAVQKDKEKNPPTKPRRDRNENYRAAPPNDEADEERRMGRPSRDYGDDDGGDDNATSAAAAATAEIKLSVMMERVELRERER